MRYQVATTIKIILFSVYVETHKFLAIPRVKMLAATMLFKYCVANYTHVFFLLARF
jgi:hypothetical protein